MKKENEPIGYCMYCHDPIYDDEDWTIVGCNVYHVECAEQLQTVCDEFGNTEEEVEE